MTARRYGPYTVDTAHERKVLFPDAGITKGDLIDYYDRIADVILPHMRGRPVTMHRFPDGIEEEGFYHKNVSDYFPGWIKRVTVERKEGGAIEHVLCENAATLVYLADQACITPHVFLSRADRLDVPDRLVVDLDPSDGNFEEVREAARICAQRFQEAGLAVFLQLTGSRGIHVVAPIERGPGFDAVRKVARSLAGQLAEEHPKLLTVEQRKEKRGRRVYLDTARNAYAQTMVTPYAVRSRPGAPVATPITLEELEDSDLSPRKYTIKNVFRRLARIYDPWKGMGRKARSLAAG